MYALSVGRQVPDPTPAEKDQNEAEDQIKEAQKKVNDKKAALNDPARVHAFDKVKDGAVHITFDIAGKGKIEAELYPKAAPETVKHFVKLAKSHFYDKTLFHRYEAGFVIQGGDPESAKVKPEDIKDLDNKAVSEKFHLGGNGSGEKVPLEAGLPHLANSIGLARSQDKASGDSQFYFNLGDNGSSLDGEYCVFGMITSGADIASSLRIGDQITTVTIK